MGENLAARSPVTVGREAELASIDRLLAHAKSGHGGCLVLLGEAGSGKTRLLREAAARAARAGSVVLFSDVPATVTPPPFGTVAQALRGWLRHAELEEAGLERFAPGLRLVLPEWPRPAEEPDLTTEQLRLLALEGVLRLVLHAGRRSGAVVVLDDLHSADPETLEFLHHASASISREPVALLVALRQGEGAPAEAEARALEQRGRATLVPVPPFDAPAVGAMVEAIVGEPPPSDLVDELMARTDGIPLLVEELLAAHVARGALRREGGALAWSLPARGLVPRTILEMVGQKLRAMPPDARRVVEAAAVLGRADPTLVGPTIGLGSDRVADALERGVEAGLLEGGPGHLAFRHALLMDAVREGLLPGQRQDLHRRAEGQVARPALEQAGLDTPL
ncbi:MAG TPA: BREX system ATP-binding domain-containing protein [Acidimicrobiales bacterium]|nr:BREX system ATP-binding domain-containing protein [Acidimicrobiales bacterium]